MPTGYTSKIHDGKEVTLQDYVLGCARAFGALIEMRDKSSETPIPEEFQPNPYHQDQIELLKLELEACEEITLSQAEKIAEQEYQQRIAEKDKSIQKRRELRKRYESMLQQVMSWKSPSEEHDGLKNFCIEQLKSSIENDCSNSYLDAHIEKETAESWLLGKKERCIKNIRYHEKEWQEEVNRVADRNGWVKSLRESL